VARLALAHRGLFLEPCPSLPQRAEQNHSTRPGIPLERGNPAKRQPGALLGSPGQGQWGSWGWNWPSKFQSSRARQREARNGKWGTAPGLDSIGGVSILTHYDALRQTAFGPICSIVSTPPAPDLCWLPRGPWLREQLLSSLEADLGTPLAQSQGQTGKRSAN